MTHCNQPTHSGEPCRYPIERCPRHARRPETAPNQPDHADARDPHAIGRLAVEHAATSSANPLQTARLMRAVTQLHAMGQAPVDEELALREIAMRGRIMNGQPPRDDEEWALAAQVFNEEALLEFHRWEARAGGQCPHRFFPAGYGTPAADAFDHEPGVPE
jgi:hypothetical protein